MLEIILKGKHVHVTCFILIVYLIEKGVGSMSGSEKSVQNSNMGTFADKAIAKPTEQSRQLTSFFPSSDIRFAKLVLPSPNLDPPMHASQEL